MILTWNSSMLSPENTVFPTPTIPGLTSESGMKSAGIGGRGQGEAQQQQQGGQDREEHFRQWHRTHPDRCKVVKRIRIVT